MQKRDRKDRKVVRRKKKDDPPLPRKEKRRTRRGQFATQKSAAEGITSGS